MQTFEVPGIPPEIARTTTSTAPDGKIPISRLAGFQVSSADQGVHGLSAHTKSVDNRDMSHVFNFFEVSMHSEILVDATELIQNPIRTGVQRVVRSLLRHWPSPTSLKLCRFTPEHGLVTVPSDVLVLLQDPPTQETRSPVELKEAIGELLSIEGPRSVPSHLPILVPEVFFDFARCAHYRWLLSQNLSRISFISFDFIPWLHPEVIGVRETAALMPYVQLLRDARHVGFISAKTRNDFATRITRQKAITGPVFTLGADGPGVLPQYWSPQRTIYLCLGSIDGRKNQDSVISAFELLWSQGIAARLVLVGRVFDNGTMDELAARITRLKALEPQFTHCSDISDEELRRLYEGARATIYVSEIEGFGLPPVESLHCGVPVIVSQNLPSIAGLPAHGQIRLNSVNADSIALAVRSLQDDEVAAKLWESATAAPTAKWADMASEVARWVEGNEAVSAQPGARTDWPDSVMRTA